MDKKNILSFFQKKNVTTVSDVANEELSVETMFYEKDCSITQGRSALCENVGKRKNGKRKFQQKWCDEFAWLVFKEGVAHCKICSKYPDISDKNSKIVQGFQGPFKIETFKLHQKSKMHKNCIDRDAAREKPECTPLAMCQKKMDAKMFEHLGKLFNTAYYIAKYNKPFTDFENLIVLLNKFNNNVGLQQYQNHMQCREFISHIAGVIRQELILEIKECSHVSLLLDASTDKCTVEELVIYVRFIRERKVKEVFLSVVPLQSSTSEGYYKTLDKEMKNLGIEWLKGQWLVGLGTDGAANMVGKENGLITKVKRNIPDVISQHCVAHKLNLSVLSAVRNVKYLDELDTVLRKLYKFYSNSPKRLKQLSQVAKLLESKLLKFQYLHKVRWVSSKVGALTALVKNFNVVVTHLEEVSNEKGDDASVAKGLLKKMTSFRFVITLHFLLDFLSILKEVSLIFQREHLLLSQIAIHIKRAINELQNLEICSGSYESSFVNSTTIAGMYKNIQLSNIDHKVFELDKKKMINDGVKYLQVRFLESENQVVRATAVFDTFTWPQENLESFGNEEIETLSQYFQRYLFSHNSKNSWEREMKSLMNEWYEFKVVGKNLQIDDLLEKVLSNCQRFPLLSHLMEIVSVLPTSTSSCERGFSHMNLIKSTNRTCMGESALSDLMMIHLNGPALKDFLPQAAVDSWYFSSKKVRHTEGHMSIKRKSSQTKFDEPNQKHC